jgi:hypothetical protein
MVTRSYASTGTVVSPEAPRQTAGSKGENSDELGGSPGYAVHGFLALQVGVTVNNTQAQHRSDGDVLDWLRSQAASQAASKLPLKLPPKLPPTLPPKLEMIAMVGCFGGMW